MFRWVTKEHLAGGPRPRSGKNPRWQVPNSTVYNWIYIESQGKLRYSIHHLSTGPATDAALQPSFAWIWFLYYRASGFQAAHIPVHNYKHPALSDYEPEKVWKAYKCIEKPVLIHCSAGIGRTGKAASYLKRRLTIR